MRKVLTPFLLNTIKIIDPETEHLLSDKTSIDCPCCGTAHQLHVRPFDRPSYFLCLNCQRAYDSVLLHHTVTESDSLQDSLDVILQHDGYIGKVNKSNYKEILKQAIVLESYNNVRTFTSDIMSGNIWLPTFVKTLRTHGLYPGAKKSDKSSLERILTLWSNKELGDIRDSGIDSRCPMYKRNPDWKPYLDRVAIPSWSPHGLAAYWFLGECGVKDITYYPTLGSYHRGGLAFLHDVTGYETVLATKDVRSAARVHLMHYRTFGRPAPLVLYSKWTTREDFDQLRGIKVIFLDAPKSFQLKPKDKKYRKTFQFALDLENSAFSRVSSKDLFDDDNFELMNEAFTPDFTTYEMMDAVVRYDSYDLTLFKSLNLNRFFSVVKRERSTKRVFERLGMLPEEFPSLVVAGRVVEETPHGYRDYDTKEMYTNFILRVNNVIHLVDKEKILYHLSVIVNGKPVYSNYADEDSHGTTGHWIKNLNARFVELGIDAKTFIKKPLNRENIFGVVWELHQEKIGISKVYPVTKKSDITYDPTYDKFLFPMVSISGEGRVTKYPDSWRETVGPTVPFYKYSTRVVSNDYKILLRNMDPLLITVIDYIALMIASQRNTDIEVKPLLLQGLECHNIRDITRAISPWPRTILDRRHISEPSETTMGKYDQRPAVIEIDRGLLELGAADYGYVLDGVFPKREHNERQHLIMKKFASRWIVESLKHILKNGFTTLKEISDYHYDVILKSSKSGMGCFKPKKNVVLSKEACLKRIGEGLCTDKIKSSTSSTTKKRRGSSKGKNTKQLELQELQ